jgi:hypothetical protein
LVALAIWILVEANTAGPVNGYTIYGVTFGWILVGAAVVLTPAWRRISLDERALRIPRGLRSSKISIADIAGVGLIYCYWPRGTGWGKTSNWDLFVWRSDGSYIADFAVSWVDLHERSGWKPAHLDDAVVASKVELVDARRIADSKPARVASDVYSRVAALQGPTGPLTTRQLQMHASWAFSDKPPLHIGYRSPDGEMGPTRWATEREALADPPIGWANR